MTPEEALKLLELSPPFGPLELKKAFRQMALRHHPDKDPSPEATRSFQQCMAAYELLIGQVNDASVLAGAPARVENLQDIFDDILGYSDETRILGYKPPEEILITLNEFVFGLNRMQKLKVYEACDACSGSGARAGARSHLCAYCFGAGRIKTAEDEKVCPKCQGRGRMIDQSCVSCGGFGRTPVVRKVRIDLRPGYQLGTTLSLALKGPGASKKMDLFLKPILRESPFFRVEKNRLVCHFFAPLSVHERGGRIDFPSLWGWVGVELPPAFDSPCEMTLENLGLPDRTDASRRGSLKLIIESVPDGKFLKMKRRFYGEVSCGNPNYGAEGPKSSWWSGLFKIFS